jgi:flagellar biosynthesis protein FliR
MDILSLAVNELVRFGVVLSRVGGLMVFAPFFSSRSMPVLVRTVSSLVFTIALLPALPLSLIPAQFGLPQLLGAMVGEVAFGMVLGLVATFVFSALQLAGQIVSFQLGFAIINLIDPQSEVETSVFSFIENILGVMFFLLVNGHHWFLKAVADSFLYLPVEGVHLKGPLVGEVLRLSAGMVSAGVQIAGPVLAVTVIADVAMGIISRAAPQINVLIVTMPMKTLIGFTCLSFSFYYLPQWLEAAFIHLFRDLEVILKQLA